MAERPTWTKAIQRYLGDEILDDPTYAQDGSDDELLDRIESAVNEILCGHYGHQIEDDQCMIPEHRYCIFCRKRVGEILADAPVGAMFLDVATGETYVKGENEWEQV